jgi:serine/threonine protein kinase
VSAQASHPFPRIPGFEIEDRIGFGGFATVYRARQPGLDRTVAIKVVHRTRTADDETLRRFRRECQAIGSLTGTPGVMTVFDLGTTADGDPYLVLEYLDGGSLQEQLEHEGRFKWLDVVRVAQGVGAALRAAHGLGILHRDIKPANVLLDHYGSVRLGDFGIAHLAGSSDSTTGDTAMTVSYAAPEMLLGKRADAASDLYSLGALMYTLLNGRPPFSRPDDDSVAAVILRITAEPVPPLPAGAAPRPLTELIGGLMEKDRKRRPNVDELLDRLERIRSDVGDGSGNASVTALRPRTSRPDDDRTRAKRDLASHGPSGSPTPGARSTDEGSSGPTGEKPGTSGGHTPPGAEGRPGDRPARRTPSFSASTVSRLPGSSRPSDPHRSSGGPMSRDRPTGPSSPTGMSGKLGANRTGPKSSSIGLSGPLGRAVFDSGPGSRGAHGGLGYAVDIVFVIDTTASMWPVLSQVKRSALGFHERLIGTMSAKGKHVSKLRVRIVAYRDFLDRTEDALSQTPFFDLPAQQDAYGRSVGVLTADGGGDEPESGLEALAVAMASPWERGLDRRRHVIVLCTDASAHPLEASAGHLINGYPRGIPPTFDELTDAWGDPGGRTVEYAAKRLLLYAPDTYPWNLISSHWDSVLHFPSRAGEGLNEVGFDQIVNAIAGSV